MIEDKRNAMIIGAMKAGTTSLFTQLSRHPDISPCLVKEPEYFTTKHRKTLDVSDYSELWSCDGRRLRLEASAGYTKYPLEQCVPERIKDYGLDPYFIYVLRDPIARIQSHINYMRNSPDWDLRRGFGQLIATSSYALQVERFERVFGGGSVLLLSFEEFVLNPAGVLKSCEEFLSLEAFEWPVSVSNENNGRYSSKMSRRISRLPLARLRRALPKGLKQYSKKTLARLSSSDKYELSDADVSHIRESLTADVQMLRSRYGFDTSQWSRWNSCEDG